MKFLRDKVATGKHEWRIFADTNAPTTFVVKDNEALEFRSEREAYGYVIAEYRKHADLRNMQPGQSYNITMADGSQKNVSVQQQGPQGVIMMDTQTGETMNVPHIQQGAEPTPSPTQKPKTPGSPSGPTPTPNVSPENITSSVLCRGDLRTAGELGREPYYCKHDQGYLYRKDPQAPEKYCAQCGMVYAASKTAGCDSDYYVEGDDCNCPAHKKAKIISDEGCINCGAKGDLDEGGQCKKCSRRKGERIKDVQDEDHEESIRQDADEADQEDWTKDEDYGDDDREAMRVTAGGNCPKCGGDGRFMDIGCSLCGGIGVLSPEKEREYIEKVRQQRGDEYVQNYLRQRGARRKVAVITGGPGSYHVKSEEGKNLGGPYKTREQAEHRLKQVEYFKHKKSDRKSFNEWRNANRIVRARDIVADAPMPGQQGMPTGDVANDSMSQMSQQTEKSTADFAEEGEHAQSGGPDAKRKLTPHEIIEEAESLIRNALVKGVRIGGSELVEYMTQYYANNPGELMEGVTLAWQKVQYEESQESGKDVAPGGQGFGPKAPTTPEEAEAMAPKNGPIQTKMI